MQILRPFVRLIVLSAVAVLMSTLMWPAASFAGTAIGMTAWRCGPEGRVYSDTPCPGGRAVELPAPRPPADIQAAERLAKREMALAERLKREREAREAAAIAASAYPVNLGPVRSLRESVEPRAERANRPQTKSPSKPKAMSKAGAEARGRDADERTWRAIAPASPRNPG